jgi:hypothetical protein
MTSAVSAEFSSTARRMGILSAATVLALAMGYGITLAVGLLSLPSPEATIGDPMFSILEGLIILMAPVMVALMGAVHAWAADSGKVLSLLGVIFMAMLALLTSTLHFAIVVLSRQPAFADQPWLPLFLSFRWPSVAYVIDIVAWDLFFALSMLCAAPVFTGSRLARSIRALMIASGVLALAGLAGVAAGDMSLRNIGIVGYLGGLLVVAALLVILFYRTGPTRP